MTGGDDKTATSDVTIADEPFVGPAPGRTSDEKPKTIWWVVTTLAVVAAGLLLFVWYSRHAAAAHKGIPSSYPPLYGRYQPSFYKWGFFALALAAIAGLAAFALARAKARAVVVIPIAVGILFSFGTSLAIVNGSTNEFVAPLKRLTAYYADYQADAHVVRQVGVRRFVQDYPQLMRQKHLLISAHSRTHPPGTTVMMSELQSIFPKHLIPRAIFIAFISSLVLIPTWFIARAFGGERAALVAVFLLAVAPAPAVFIFLNLDAFHATLLASSAALLVWGLTKKDSHWGVMLAGGFLLGLTSFFSYQVTFIATFAVLYSFFVRPWKDAARLLVLAGIGGVVALGILWVVFRFNFYADFNVARAVAPRLIRTKWYWAVGDPAVWLIYVGLPIAALSLRELVTKRPVWLLCFFVPLVVADFTWLFLGETERVGQFATPFIAAAAGIALVRWERESGRDRSWVFASLVIFAALQAIAIEALYWTVF